MGALIAEVSAAPFAHQRLGHHQGQRLLAHAFGAGEEQGSGHAIASQHFADSRDGLRIAEKGIEAHVLRY